MEIFNACEILRKICLALTCKRMLSISLDDIEDAKSKLASPWVNTRIICVGDYADDLPPNVLTTSQQTKLSKSNDYGSYSYGGLEFMLRKRVTLYTGHIDDKLLGQFVARFPKQDRDRFEELYGLHYPPRDDWVVCNLTRGLYVRASSVAALSKQPAITSPFMPQCEKDLGHALLSQICWTSDPSGCVASPNGAWAGNRFCITTLDRMPAAPDGKEWNDVSAKMCKAIRSIWSSW